MSYWLRELMGWVLLAIGLAVFGLVLLQLIEGMVYQTMGMIIVGIFIFRGGIHLLKIAVAAEVCLEAEDRLKERPAVNRGTFVAAKRF